MPKAKELYGEAAAILNELEALGTEASSYFLFLLKRKVDAAVNRIDLKALKP